MTSNPTATARNMARPPGGITIPNGARHLKRSGNVGDDRPPIRLALTAPKNGWASEGLLGLCLTQGGSAATSATTPPRASSSGGSEKWCFAADEASARKPG